MRPLLPSPGQPLLKPDWNPNRRCYDEYLEYLQMLHAANEAVIEQTRLGQEVNVLHQELQAARFAVEQLDNLGSADLARIGCDLRAKLGAITSEQRQRHWLDGEMP